MLKELVSKNEQNSQVRNGVPARQCRGKSVIKRGAISSSDQQSSRCERIHQGQICDGFVRKIDSRYGFHTLDFHILDEVVRKLGTDTIEIVMEEEEPMRAEVWEVRRTWSTTTHLAVLLNLNRREVNIALACDGNDICPQRFRAEELRFNDDTVHEYQIVNVVLKRIKQRVQGIFWTGVLYLGNRNLPLLRPRELGN